MRTSERVEESAESVPVILRIRSHRTESPAQVASRGSVAPSRRFKFNLRGEQLILLAATPLLALVITMGWKMLGHQDPVALENTEPAPQLVRIEAVPGATEVPVLPTVEVDPTVILTPDPLVPEDEKSVTNGAPNRTTSEFSLANEETIRRTSGEQPAHVESLENQERTDEYRPPHTPGLRTSRSEVGVSYEGSARIRSVLEGESERWNRRPMGR